MLGSTFYHSLTRKYISVFGNLFNDIYVRRVNKEGTRIQTIPVPVRYSKKQRWMEQLATQPQDQKYSIHLPFIAFEQTALTYQGDRQASPLGRLKKIATDDRTKMFSTFAPINYKMELQLTIVAKNQDDICQIYEQILPYFTPDHVNTIELIPEIEYKHDTTITLVGISPEDTYEGDFKGDSRTIRYTLNFEMDVVFVGPVSKQGVIKRIIINYTDSDMNNINERTIITPGLTLDGKPTSIKEESIPYYDIHADDDYGFIQEDFTYTSTKNELDIER